MRHFFLVDDLGWALVTIENDNSQAGELTNCNQHFIFRESLKREAAYILTSFEFEAS